MTDKPSENMKIVTTTRKIRVRKIRVSNSEKVRFLRNLSTLLFIGMLVAFGAMLLSFINFGSFGSETRVCSLAAEINTCIITDKTLDALTSRVGQQMILSGLISFLSLISSQILSVFANLLELSCTCANKKSARQT